MKNTTATGNKAEQGATEYLIRLGFKILERNWRTRWCEIDIVAIKDGVVYFVEVKYRSSPNSGAGLDYIAPKKLKQMAFAAEFWVTKHNFTAEYELAAAEVDHNDKVSNFIAPLT